MIALRRKHTPQQITLSFEMEEEIKKYEEYSEKLKQLRKEGEYSKAYEKLGQEYEKKLVNSRGLSSPVFE